MARTEEQLAVYREEFAEILPTVTRWHEMAVKQSRIAIWCAACCGQELIERRKAIGRGGWMKFLEVLPFSVDTAKRYIDLAVAWKERVGQIPHSAEFAQIGAPSSKAITLNNDQFSEIYDATTRAVGEVSLRQLYFDWGICKDYSRPGGNVRNNNNPPAAPTEEEIRQVYVVEWASILEKLTEHGRRQRTYVHLEDGELEVHRAGLAYVVSELDDEIKRRGNAKKGKK
jgi:hypothetical protein